MKSTTFSSTPPFKQLRNLEMGRSITITELPDQIIADILSRLPTKTLFASRCVCKSWLSLTTNDPQFAKLHFSRSRIELLLQFSAFYDANRTFGLVDLELDTTRGFGTRVKIKPQFDTPLHQSSYYQVGYVVVNSCGGLVCLKDTCINENPAIICNPLTGEYIMLPDCDDCRIGYFYASGFGFCSSTNQYKVLRISSDKLMPFWENVGKSREAEINVVGSSSWRRIGYAPFIPRNTSNPIFTNGVIHWVCDVNRTPKFIVTFDFESEKFGEISPPSQIGKFHHNRKYNMSLGVLGGCLALCDIFRRGKFDIWVMKEYGIQESWSKDFVIDTTGMGLLLRGKHQPITCLSNGEILMHSLEENNLVCYNPVKNSVRCLKIPWGRHFEAVVHSPSFVLLKDAIKPIIGDSLKVLNVRESQEPKAAETEAFSMVEYFWASVAEKRRLPSKFYLY